MNNTSIIPVNAVVELIALYLIFINILSFILMGIDKARARHHMWRISETTFYILSLFQGYIGILLGSIVFHHKTRKISFQIINLLMFINGAIIAIAILMHLGIILPLDIS